MESIGIKPEILTLEQREVGKWYKGSGIFDWQFCQQDNGSAYGFHDGTYNTGYSLGYSKTCTEMTNEEVKDLLVKEARRRRLINTAIRSLMTGERDIVGPESQIRFFPLVNTLWIDGTCVFKDGVWAEMWVSEEYKEFEKVIKASMDEIIFSVDGSPEKLRKTDRIQPGMRMLRREDRKTGSWYRGIYMGKEFRLYQNTEGTFLTHGFYGGEYGTGRMFNDDFVCVEMNNEEVKIMLGKEADRMGYFGSHDLHRPSSNELYRNGVCTFNNGKWMGVPTMSIKRDVHADCLNNTKINIKVVLDEPQYKYVLANGPLGLYTKAVKIEPTLEQRIEKLEKKMGL